MKHVHITLEDWEAEKLEKIKDKTTWHDFILQLLDDKKGKTNETNY